jgi:2-methylcitrate dehydratase PrpD
VDGLSRRLARAARAIAADDLPETVIDKVRIGFLDMLSCAFEARDLPWGAQAIALARRSSGVGSVIGTPFRVSTGDAAFANATLGHGLVREDMHTGAVSHLGVVIYPALLACAQRQVVSGRRFILAAACGYEIGAAIGRALVDPKFVQFHRPTGTTGPIGAAAAGSILLDLNEGAMVSAIGFAANTAGGLNEWPYAGGDEMFFHPGFAARSAVTAVELAELGAFAAEAALDGRAGLFASLDRGERALDVHAFRDGLWEILSVYYKPAPACNYAQTACQAALALGIPSREIEKITVRCSAAAVAYPGCNFAGPYERILQAKMSIQYCVAATLAQGRIAEENYRLLDDPEVARLVSVMTLEAGDEFTAAYPGKQGAEVSVVLRSGTTCTVPMEDVIPATPDQIRHRFRLAASKAVGDGAADRIEAFIDTLEEQPDAGALGRLLEKDK